MKVKLNNLMIQLRKNCNHPDLLQSAFDGSCMSVTFSFMLLCKYSEISLGCFCLLLTVQYPPVEQIVEQCGKFRLLERLLTKLFALKHKVSCNYYMYVLFVNLVTKIIFCFVFCSDFNLLPVD